jgi:hypothetical protein
MPGLKVIRVIASILQVAELGAKVSVKLCTFYRTVKVANQSLQKLSSDVSFTCSILTCSILTVLSKSVNRDFRVYLCSKQAFTTQEVLQGCRAVFEEIKTQLRNIYMMRKQKAAYPGEGLRKQHLHFINQIWRFSTMK